MKLGSLFFTGALACDRCIGCADGVQIVNPIGVELLCQDEKAYVQVDEKTNFAKIDVRRLKDGKHGIGYYDASRCSATHYSHPFGSQLLTCWLYDVLGVSSPV